MCEQVSSPVSVTSRQLGHCHVCDAVAVGINFGVPTCAPCKAFFRRNAVKLGKVEFVCLYDGDCRVSYEDRRFCNCCRLAKCFRVGMQRSRIQSDEEKQARKELIERNREKRTALASLQKLSSIRPAISLHLNGRGPKLLSASDQTLLTNINFAYERHYAQADSDRYAVFPTRDHSQIYTLFNDFDERGQPMIGYLELIPEFGRLSIGDQARLIRANYGQLFHFNESILTRSFHENFVGSVRGLFGSTIANSLVTARERRRECAHDPLLLKLILIVWTFSMGMNRYEDNMDIERIFDDTLTIFACESIYVDLLWRYLASRLPSTRDVVKFFDRFVVNSLYLQRSCLALDQHMQNLQNEIKQMSLFMQNMWPSRKDACITQDGSVDEPERVE